LDDLPLARGKPVMATRIVLDSFDQISRPPVSRCATIEVMKG
jgi:hypothetical protein